MDDEYAADTTNIFIDSNVAEMFASTGLTLV